MSRTFLGFYDLDAAPQHGVTGDLATRLGAATSDPGFVDGAVYVRSDNAAVAVQLQHPDEDGWEDRGNAAVLLQAADWRSRRATREPYRLARQVPGDGDPVTDSTFYIVQRFVVKPDVQATLVETIARIPNASQLRSQDFSQAMRSRAWTERASSSSCPGRTRPRFNRSKISDGSLAAMQSIYDSSEHHSYASFERVSYLRARPERRARERRREPARPDELRARGARRGRGRSAIRSRNSRAG